MKHLNPLILSVLFLATSATAQAAQLYSSHLTESGDRVSLYKMSEFEMRMHLDEHFDELARAASEEDANASDGEGLAEQVGEVVENLSMGKVWVVGKKIYEIVKENEAVLDVSTDHWNVLPEGVKSSSKLEHWSKPEYSGWVVNYENFYGMNVARLSFLTAYNYGGSFEGRGKYLSNVTFIPRDVHTLWGYTMNVEAEAFEAVNEASSADPVVGLSYHLRMKLGTLIKKSMLDFQYYVNGKGELDVVPVN